MLLDITIKHLWRGRCFTQVVLVVLTVVKRIMRSSFGLHSFSTFFPASKRWLTETTESVECASVVEIRQRVEQLLSLLNEAVN